LEVEFGLEAWNLAMEAWNLGLEVESWIEILDLWLGSLESLIGNLCCYQWLEFRRVRVRFQTVPWLGLDFSMVLHKKGCCVL
jgi:hypothetical protein